VGDIESLPFLEAIRQMRLEVGYQNALNIHVTLLPYIKTAGEVKTKPTQHSVQKLREIGIQPDIILARHDHPLEPTTRDKLSLFCNVTKECVIAAPDVPCIYDLPEHLHDAGLDDRVVELMGIWSREPELDAWVQFAQVFKTAARRARIGIVGKYVELTESYKSLHEALVHGGVANECTVELVYIDAEELERDGAGNLLGDVDGVLVPGGFGLRGAEGKISAVKWARENGVPFFGICLGMQIAVIEFARHVCGLEGAHSTEFEPATAHPVVHLMPDQRGVTDKGATMRLGAYPCVLDKDTLAARIYGTRQISERHRHRYEVNNDFRVQLGDKGLRLSGVSPDGRLVEMCEIGAHPYFVGCQFHPEFKSRPTRPHPLFTEFVAACLKRAADMVAAA